MRVYGRDYQFLLLAGIAAYRADENRIALEYLRDSRRMHADLSVYILEKLKSIPDGDGSLLDHSMYLFGSGMGDPDTHDHANLPI